MSSIIQVCQAIFEATVESTPSQEGRGYYFDCRKLKLIAIDRSVPRSGREQEEFSLHSLYSVPGRADLEPNENQNRWRGTFAPPPGQKKFVCWPSVTLADTLPLIAWDSDTDFLHR